MSDLKIFLQRIAGAIGGAIGGFLIFAPGGFFNGIQWGASIGIFIGAIEVFAGKGFAGFIEALLNSILIGGALGAVLSGLLGIFGGGLAGSTWGSKDENITGASELPRSTIQQDSGDNTVLKEGLTEKILFAFDPRNPLGRKRFVFYNILFFLAYFAVLFLMAILLSPGDPSAVTDIPWFQYGVSNVLAVPHWLLGVRRALAAKIPVQVVYAFMSWTLVFSPICGATVGQTLSLLLALPSLVLVVGLLFKRNRIRLPYDVN